TGTTAREHHGRSLSQGAGIGAQGAVGDLPAQGAGEGHAPAAPDRRAGRGDCRAQGPWIETPTPLRLAALRIRSGVWQVSLPSRLREGLGVGAYIAACRGARRFSRYRFAT